jgi:hypothetical protein
MKSGKTRSPVSRLHYFGIVKKAALVHTGDMAMPSLVMQRALMWWQWLLIATGCCAVAIITGPSADRLGYATSRAGLIVSILAWIACTVCWTIGIIRFAKWVGRR